MIKKIYTYQHDNTYPYKNLAHEAALLEAVGPDEVILFLWQNDHTVVIGRHQNAWKECRAEALEADGGHLVRRLSGGGAVYHDLENLNFTFLIGAGNYDVTRQSRVILEAVKNLGLHAELSGRNDITIDGRKFSGNAYYRSGEQRYHHGTLLVNVNTEAMAEFLKPSQAKLKSKGVESVRSRVVNLKDLLPDLTIAALSEAMVEAFESVYGMASEPFPLERLSEERIASWQRQFETDDWKYGRRMPFGFEVEARFDWGTIDVQLEVKQGLIHDVQIYSDAIDDKVIPQLAERLQGVPFKGQAIREALEAPAEAGAIEAAIYTDTAQLIIDGM